MKQAHQLTANVKLLHKVVLIHNEQFLIVKRSSDALSRPNAWDLPGGNSEWPDEENESGFDYHKLDIAREIKEETGIQVNKDHFDKSNLIYFHTFFDSPKQIYTIICGWKLNLDTPPEIILSHEHQEYCWIELAQINNFDFGGERGSFIKDIIGNCHG